MMSDEIGLFKFRMAVETEIPEGHFSMISLIDVKQWAPTHGAQKTDSYFGTFDEAQQFWKH